MHQKEGNKNECLSRNLEREFLRYKSEFYNLSEIKNVRWSMGLRRRRWGRSQVVATPMFTMATPRSLVVLSRMCTSRDFGVFDRCLPIDSVATSGNHLLWRQRRQNTKIITGSISLFHHKASLSFSNNINLESLLMHY